MKSQQIYAYIDTSSVYMVRTTRKTVFYGKWEFLFANLNYPMTGLNLVPYTLTKYYNKFRE